MDKLDTEMKICVGTCFFHMLFTLLEEMVARLFKSICWALCELLARYAENVKRCLIPDAAVNVVCVIQNRWREGQHLDSGTSERCGEVSLKDSTKRLCSASHATYTVRERWRVDRHAATDVSNDGRKMVVGSWQYRITRTPNRWHY